MSFLWWGSSENEEELEEYTAFDVTDLRNHKDVRATSKEMAALLLHHFHPDRLWVIAQRPKKEDGND